MEREIIEALLDHDVNTIIHMNISSFIDPLKLLRLMRLFIRNKIIVILPPEDNDEVLSLLKLWIMSNFPGKIIIAYRSFSLGKDEILLAF